MAEYSSLKVPELKKLLAEKGLPQTGNKADLIARLVGEDNKAAASEDNQGEAQTAPATAEATTEAVKSDAKEDEINYSDDEAPAAKATGDQDSAPQVADKESTSKDQAEPQATDGPSENAPAAVPPTNYAMGLSSSTADEEAKKRADRAKRFGIEEDDDSKKRAERAQRFGLDDKELASGLDSALPERPLKRGRGRGGDDSSRPGKRQSLDRRGGGRRRGGRPNNPARNGGGAGSTGAPARRGGIMNDPTEKAKAEKRAARFAAA